jgi:hypothetical protein
MSKAKTAMKVARKITIPYVAKRILARYAPELREQMTCAVRETMQTKGSDVLTWEELKVAINDALAAYTPIDEVMADPRMERLSKEAMAAGNFLSGHEFSKRLHAKLAGACSE